MVLTMKVRVEQRIDWVWSILDESNNVICDGYSASESEAWQDATGRGKQEIDRRTDMADPNQEAIAFIRATVEAEEEGAPGGIRRLPYGLWSAVAETMEQYRRNPNYWKEQAR